MNLVDLVFEEMEFNRKQEERIHKGRLTQPRKGDVFTHLSYLDQQRQPAKMKVTRVTGTTVYFTYADTPDNKGAFYLDRTAWIDRYGVK